jgi:hypothetical protein
VERYPNRDDEYLIMATTSSRIIQFVGGPSFEEVFEDYSNNIKKLKSQEMPFTKKNLNISDLILYSSEKNKPADSFAWLSGIF